MHERLSTLVCNPVGLVSNLVAIFLVIDLPYNQASGTSKH